MKKVLLFFVVIITVLTFFTINTYAVALPLNVTQSDTKINPGDEVTLTLNFGTELATYTFYFNYDPTKLEYVSTNGGRANAADGSAIVSYTDTTVGEELKESMTITFRAQSDIKETTTANISIVADGLGTASAEVYDDILTPIVKTITIEPEVVPTPTPTPTPKPTATPTPTPKPTATPTPTSTPTPIENAIVPNETETVKEQPKELPKTGINLYATAFILILILGASYIYLSKKK